MRVIAPYASRFAPYVSVSANADVLLWYFGWVLRVPLLRRLVLNLPFLPRLASIFARWLPRRPVRGRTAAYTCDFNECDVVQYEARLAACRYPEYDVTLPAEFVKCCGTLPPLPRPLPTPYKNRARVQPARLSPQNARLP